MYVNTINNVLEIENWIYYKQYTVIARNAIYEISFSKTYMFKMSLNAVHYLELFVVFQREKKDMHVKCYLENLERAWKLF